MRLIFHIVAIAASAAAQVLCGPESQVLFQSNAYADSIVPSSPPYQGGSELRTQREWDEFLGYFQPNNYGESLFRTSIDFLNEKVVVATYFTTSTCNVDISNAQLECSDADSSVQMKLTLDVFDASLDCDIKCMALGQVVYAVAVPKAWVIDEDTGFQINVTGPCVSDGLRVSPYEHAASIFSPETIMLDTQTTMGATTTTTQSPGELSTSSSSATTSTSLGTTSSPPETILLDTQTTTGATTTTAMSEEYGTHSNDFASTASSETTSTQTTTTTEPAQIEKSQLLSEEYGTHSNDVTITVSSETTSPQTTTTTTEPAQIEKSQLLSEEYGTHSNDVTITVSSETTSSPTTTTTEPAPTEESQLRGTVPTHDIIVEDFTIPEDLSETSDQNISIEADTTTTTPVPKTNTATTVIATGPSIPADISLTASRASKAANEPENTSSSLRQHYLISFILFTIGVYSL